VTIRAHRPEDAERVWEQCQDPLSQQWTTVPIPYTREMAEEFVTRTMPGAWADDSEWAFAFEVDGRYGGTCSLRNEGDARAEIAYGSHPDVRGTGVVERALRLLLDWGFEEKGLHTVVWWANQGNWSSRKLAWRLGFRMEGSLREWLPQRGDLLDAWVGTLLRTDPREPQAVWLDCPVLEVDGLESDGLRLRPFRETDVDRIVEACRDERTQYWLGQLPAPYTVEDAREYVESRLELMASAQAVTWAVADPADDRLLGAIGWFHWTPEVECEIGYWTHPDSRGRGLMTRALRRLTTHVFDTLHVRRVTAFAAVDNAASRHVIEAAGYRQYAVERYGAHVRDAWVDMALYDVTSSEWAEERSARAARASTTNPASDSSTPTSNGDR
jgi:RimJ/RimL family protein N-acetyltransferase